MTLPKGSNQADLKGPDESRAAGVDPAPLIRGDRGGGGVDLKNQSVFEITFQAQKWDICGNSARVSDARFFQQKPLAPLVMLRFHRAFPLNSRRDAGRDQGPGNRRTAETW
jgi:hypothetical protein